MQRCGQDRCFSQGCEIPQAEVPTVLWSGTLQSRAQSGSTPWTSFLDQLQGRIRRDYVALLAFAECRKKVQTRCIAI